MEKAGCILTFDNYDYEEAYQKQIDTLEEWELERLLKEQKVDCLYRTTTTKAGSQLEADIYPSFYKKTDIPKTKSKRETKPSQKNLNEKRSKRYFNNLVSENFGPGDLWGTFGYDNNNIPKDMDEAQKIFGKFIRRINYRRKKRGQDNLKYIYVTEYSEDPKRKIRVHHHIIFSGDCDRDEIESLWKHGSRPETKRLKPDDDTFLAGLCTYITKDPKGCKRWTPSKNLNKPNVSRSYSKFKKGNVKKMIHDHEYMEKIFEKKYPGYKFIDAEIKLNGINDSYYIYARMCRN
jgi:hypothetical protein